MIILHRKKEVENERMKQRKEKKGLPERREENINVNVSATLEAILMRAFTSKLFLFKLKPLTEKILKSLLY